MRAIRAAAGLFAISLLLVAGCGGGGGSGDLSHAHCEDLSVSPPVAVDCADPRADRRIGFPEQADGKGEGLFRPRGF